MSERKRRPWDGSDFWLGGACAAIAILIGDWIWGALT